MSFVLKGGMKEKNTSVCERCQPNTRLQTVSGAYFWVQKKQRQQEISSGAMSQFLMVCRQYDIIAIPPPPPV